MYRDDPLDDEAELRELLGDADVDRLVAADRGRTHTPLEAALDVLRVLQGWVPDEQAARWLVTPQRRLQGAQPVDALCAGGYDEVADAARAWAAAQG
ncbi:MAG: hypothetical protein ACNA8R_06585 [Nitriliruptoraceae bacterium]